MTRNHWFVPFVIGASLLIAFAGNAPRVQADNRLLHWNFWNTDISNIDTTSNAFHVVESQQIGVEIGPFNGADRHVPLSRLTGIDNIHVFDGEKELKPYDLTPDKCGTALGIICLSIDATTNEQVIYWNFTSQAQSGTTRTMKIEYDVHGALRSYPDGDQLYWTAFSDNRPFPLSDESVTLHLPTGLIPQKIATYPAFWQKHYLDESTLVFVSAVTINNLTDNVAVRVQYPHNPAMTAPPWQKNYDQSQNTNTSS